MIVGDEGLRIGPEAWTGAGLAALAASLYRIGLTFARLHLSGHEPIELAFGQLAAGAVLLIPFALVTAGDAHPTPASAGAILGIAIVSTAIAWPLLFRLNQQVGPLATSTIPFLNPIFGVLWGALFLADPVAQPHQVADIIVIDIHRELHLDRQNALVRALDDQVHLVRTTEIVEVRDARFCRLRVPLRGQPRHHSRRDGT